jgi:hypothetical protein
MISLIALVNEQGTACSEACLCSDCDSPDMRIGIEKNIWTDAIPGSWIDCTGNSELFCVHCGIGDRWERIDWEKVYKDKAQMEKNRIEMKNRKTKNPKIGGLDISKALDSERREMVRDMHFRKKGVFDNKKTRARDKEIERRVNLGDFEADLED